MLPSCFFHVRLGRWQEISKDGASQFYAAYYYCISCLVTLSLGENVYGFTLLVSELRADYPCKKLNARSQ